MRRRLQQKVNVVHLPKDHAHGDETGSCGMYAGLLTTKK